jgi:hypothetical protein
LNQICKRFETNLKIEKEKGKRNKKIGKRPGEPFRPSIAQTPKGYVLLPPATDSLGPHVSAFFLLWT